MVHSTAHLPATQTQPSTLKFAQPVGGPIQVGQSQLGGVTSTSLAGRGGGRLLEMGDTDVQITGVSSQSNATIAVPYGGPSQGLAPHTFVNGSVASGPYNSPPLSSIPTQPQPPKVITANQPSAITTNGNAASGPSTGNGVGVNSNRPPTSGPSNSTPSNTSTLQNQTPRPSTNRGAMENMTTRHTQPELFSRDYLERAQRRAAVNVGVSPGELLIGFYADRSISLVLQDFARSLIRIKDHRLHTSQPPAPPYWTSKDDAGKQRPMWSLELVDEPHVTHCVLVAHQKQEEREDRRRRKQRMNELAAKKALAASAPRNDNENAVAGPSSHGTPVALGSPADTTGGAPSPAPDGDNKPVKARPKTAEEKAAAKAQREAAKKAKDEAAAAAGATPGAGKKKIKEPDVREANRSMGTHLAGVGKKRTFAWMPGADTPAFGGTLNAKLLGSAKKRKLGNEEGKDGMVVPAWKGKVGLSKLGTAKAEADAPPAPTSARAAGVKSVHSYLEGGHSFPALPDTVTLVDYKSALERYILRGGPTKQIFIREWERLLLKMAQEDQDTAKRNAADVAAVYKVPPCHPGDELAYEQKVREQEEREEAASRTDLGGAATTTPTTASSGFQTRPVPR